MLKPIIGVTPSIENNADKYFVSSDNIQAITRAGGIPLILPFLTEEENLDAIAEQIDGLYLSGGNDVDPAYFSEEPHPKLGSVNPARDFFEIAFIKKMLRLKKPIFGVCRGCQVLNVAMGGTMYQDIYAQMDGELLQHQQDAPSDHASHFVNVTKGSLLKEIVGTEQIKVNSRHHQANRNVGDDLAVCGTANDGVLEAIEGTNDFFVLGVQWHPENLMLNGDIASEKIFEYFIKSC